MGIGDQLIATGLARGAAARGKRIAFGDGKRILWDVWSPMIFQNNPNIAAPGSERAADIEWIHYYKKERWYSRANGHDRWVFNYDFRATPGELFFDKAERVARNDDLILIEPNLPNKIPAPNKKWPLERWRRVADELTQAGFCVRQFDYGKPNKVTRGIHTPTFRHAAALLKSARMAILPEGGLHHAAAAVGCPAVVIFGGYVPPAVLGYDTHINLTGGAKACGNFKPCRHCAEAMDRIKADDVLDACEEILCR
jgi:hypothetical protein